MLQHVMTDATFAKGLQYYLTDRYEKSAIPDDLYRNLQIALNTDFPTSSVNIADFMKTWELQPGYPVITITRQLGSLTLTQARYHQNTNVDPTNSRWSIPLNFATKSQPDFTRTTPDTWMNEISMTIQNDTFKSWAANDWVLFNLQETGYYRVNYDLPTWMQLSNELTSGNIALIHLVNRAQLIDDSFNLARSQRLPYNIPFELLRYLRRETDYIPWASTDRALTFLHPYLFGSPEYPRFAKMMRENANAIYTRLGSTSKPTDAFLDIYGRNLAIKWACWMDHEQCLIDTAALMVRVAQNTLKIEPDLEAVVWCYGLRRATEATFNSLLSTALLPANETNKAFIMTNLGCSQNSSMLTNYVQSSILVSSSYTTADRARVITSVYTNGGALGVDLVLDFLANNYAAFASMLIFYFIV